MNTLGNPISPTINCGYEPEDSVSAYNMLLLLTGLAVATYGFALFAESQNNLQYESRMMRIVAGFFILFTNLLHTSKGDLEIDTQEGAVVAIVPHRAGAVDALVVASKMRGMPPRFFATNLYNSIPGVEFLLNALQIITVDYKAKASNGQKANKHAEDEANAAIKNKECIAIFPQGNFAKIGEDAPTIQAGTARMVINNGVKLHVVRIDGLWCMENPFIPQWIRNNAYYRAVFSLLHPNNARVTVCAVIDVHLKPENVNLPEKDKMDLINAQLYAYSRRTGDLTKEQIKEIDGEIASNRHLKFWENRVKQEVARKELISLKKEEASLMAPGGM